MTQHQSQSLHHAARDRRHLRRRHLHALDRDRGRHGHPGARRQRLRRRGGDRLHAAGGRAAPQRARRRRAGDRARHPQGQGQDRGDLRAGAGAGRRHHRALQEPRPRSRARHRAARLLRARHVRDLDAAAARLRHHARSPTCSSPRSTTPAKASRWSSARAPPSARSSSCSASTGRRRRRSICRAARCRRPARCSPTSSSPRPIRASCARPRASGGNRDEQIEHARKMWSHGFVAEAIDRFCRTQEVMDSSGERHRGVLTADDMARLQPRVEAPVTYQYGRYTVCKGGFWSQGPAMLQQLALLKGFDLDGADPTSADFIHTVVECSKLAYADRETFYGDPDFVKVPGDVLLSEAYNDARRKLVGEEASLEQRPGNIPGYGMRLAIRVPGGKRLAAPGAGEPTVGAGAGLDARRHDRSEPRRGRRRRQARTLRRHARRHRAFRHHRPRRQHGVGDAVRRLAAILADDPRARLLSRHAARSSSGSTKAIRTRSRPASARAPRSRRRWRCATASPISPGARPAATSRTSGSRRCSCAMSIAA